MKCNNIAIVCQYLAIVFINICSLYSTDPFFKAMVYVNHNLLKNKSKMTGVWGESEEQQSRKVSFNPVHTSFHDTNTCQLPRSYFLFL